MEAPFWGLRHSRQGAAARLRETAIDLLLACEFIPALCRLRVSLGVLAQIAVNLANNLLLQTLLSSIRVSAA